MKLWTICVCTSVRALWTASSLYLKPDILCLVHLGNGFYSEVCALLAIDNRTDHDVTYSMTALIILRL